MRDQIIADAASIIYSKLINKCSNWLGKKELMQMAVEDAVGLMLMYGLEMEQSERENKDLYFKPELTSMAANVLDISVDVKGVRLDRSNGIKVAFEEAKMLVTYCRNIETTIGKWSKICELIN